MSDSVLALLIMAAAGHAVWNALSRDVPERSQFYTLIIFVAVIVYAPVAVYLYLTTHVPVRALLWVGGSTLFEVMYFTCLAKAYRMGTFLTVYPVARGTSPLITTAISLVFLDVSLPWITFAGIAVVVLGILCIHQSKFSFIQIRTTLTSPGISWALLTGLCTASYSVCDAQGALCMSPVLFKYMVFAGMGVGKWGMDSLSLARESYLVILRKYPYRTIIGGVLVFGVNAVIVYTLKSTPVALVATIRELSIIFASIIGIVWLKEKVTSPKLISIGLIVAGVLMIRG